MAKPFIYVDFDNTLMATEHLVLPSLIERFNLLYEDIINTPLTLELFVQHFHGKARESLCQALSKYFSIQVDYEKLYENREMNVIYGLKKYGVEMAPKVIEVLNILHQTYQLALVTNSPLQRIFGAMRYATNGRGAELAACFGTNFFEASLHPKPDPWVYSNALSLLETSTTTALAIEDSVTGVKSATCAGLRTIGFLGFSDQPDHLEDSLMKNGALACFHTWEEILAFIHTL